MPKILTDKVIIEKFLTRGVENIYPSAIELRKKLMIGEKLKIYQGFDPTGPYLHIGHAIGIRALRLLQQLGHEVIFLVGDFTAKIGDPDKDTARKMLTDEEIEDNMASWKIQAAQLIDFSGDNPVLFKRNYEWLSKLRFAEVIKLMSHITVQQMLGREMFDKRMKSSDPIKLHEFIYPLMQGYDSIAMDIDIEVAGADQTFNALVGRDLCRAYLNKEKFVRTNKMMDAPDGRTMSKTKGNGINLGDASEDMYGKAMSYPDSAIVTGLELLTDLPLDDIHEIANLLGKGENPMELKKTMAYEIVKIIRGEKSADKAKEHFEKTVQKKERPVEVETINLNKKKIMADGKITVTELFMCSGLVASKNEIRRLIAQNGLKINDRAVKDIDFDYQDGEEFLLQKGKRFFKKVVLK